MNTDLEMSAELDDEAPTVHDSRFASENIRTFAGVDSASAAQFAEAISGSRIQWPKPTRNADPFLVAAGLSAIGLVAIALVAIAALVAYQYLRESVRFSEKSRQIEQIATNVSRLQSRVDAIEADPSTGRAGEPGAVELRTGDPSSPVFIAAIAQVTARVDRVRDEAAMHFADIGARLDKLEANAVAPLATIPSPPAPAAQPPAPAPASADPPAAAAAEPVAPSKRVLWGFALARVRDGVASIRGPDGETSASVGDSIPGGGKVISIKRTAGRWVVFTSLGEIRAAPKRHVKPHHAARG